MLAGLSRDVHDFDFVRVGLDGPVEAARDLLELCRPLHRGRVAVPRPARLRMDVVARRVERPRPGEPSPPSSAGVREPRRPTPMPRSMAGMIDETSGEAIG